nr:hypothetical protein [Tanacetum cinerariifolium]
MMGKISFFLGLQISQSLRGIFINQSKYALESLKKYDFESYDPVDTPMEEKSKLDEDKEGKAVDPSHYRGMIGTLLYLTASRPDLQFAICMCARYQAWPIEKHIHAVKKIFRYLRGTVNRGLWTMDTTIDQQVAMDEALVPHAHRLRIGRSFSGHRMYSGNLHAGILGDSHGSSSLYSVEHKYTKKSNEMYYPRFTKVIIHHFMSKDLSIPRRNKVNWHYVRDDQMFTTIKLVSRHQNTQQFGAMLPIELTNAEIENSDAYKEYYAVATGATPPKTKASIRKTKSSSDTTITPPPTAAAGTRLFTSAKGKQPATTSKAKSLTALSEVAMTEAQQLKLVTKRSLQQTHMSQASDFGADKGTGTIPGVLDVPTEESDKEISWKSSEKGDDGDDDDDAQDDDDDQEDANKDDDDQEEGNDEDDQEEGSDDEQASDEDCEEFIHLSLSTHDEEETRDKKSFDPIPKTPENTDDEGNGEENLGINTSMLNPTPDVGIESIFETTSQMDVQTPTSVAPLPVSAPTLTPSTIATITAVQQAPTPPTTAPSTLLQDLPNFVKVQVSKILPKIGQTVNEQLEAEVLTWSSSSSKTSYAVAADHSEMELKKILIEKIEGNKSIHRSNEQRNLYKALVEAYESDKIILDTYGDTITLKRRRDDDADKDEEPSARSDWGSKRRRKERSQSQQALQRRKLPGALASRHKGLNLDKCRQASADDQPIAEPSQHPEWFSQQKKPPTPDRDWNKTLSATHESIQPWISDLAKKTNSHSSFNELMDTPVDFSAFMMNRLKVDTLTPKLLGGPTYELMKWSCKSLVELEFFLEEVYKATTDQLDWVNPEGQQYPHNLLKPLPLIPNSRGRRVIPFDHFINNDLEYLRGGASSHYGHIKWIEDLVPQTMWIQEPVGYDKHALCGISHWGRKRQQFYGFVVNRESARDVYFKRRIIAVTELKIVKWHNYKHLDWITVRRDDDKLYKFKEGNFKRLRIQDIEDMLLLLRKEAYIAYSNPRGFIYQNKDKQNRLMRIDELHKFSDGTLTDVRTALDDHLKGIRMKYMPQTIWRKSDKDRATAMI